MRKLVSFYTTFFQEKKDVFVFPSASTYAKKLEKHVNLYQFFLEFYCTFYTNTIAKVQKFFWCYLQFAFRVDFMRPSA